MLLSTSTPWQCIPMSRKHIKLLAVLLTACFCGAALFSIKTLPSYPKRTHDEGNVTARILRKSLPVTTFLKKCYAAGIHLFVMEPKVLSGISKNAKWLQENPDILEGWARREHTALTFGLIQTGSEDMTSIARELDVHAGLTHHAVQGLDTRGLSMRFFQDNRNLTAVPMHYVWWARDDVTATPLLHVVMFRPRAGKLWHGGLVPDRRGPGNGPHTLPFNVSALTVGRQAKMVDRFDTATTEVEGTHVSYPVDVGHFLRVFRDGTFMECDYSMAKSFYQLLDADLATPGDSIRNRVMDHLRKATKVLNKLGIRFWLSSGILLGWYRQCDVMPYTNDVDIEISIKEYSDKIVPAFLKDGYQFLHQRGKVSDSLQMAFHYIGLKLDIVFIYDDDDRDVKWYGIFQANELDKFRAEFPKYSLNWAELNGLAVRVPDKPVAYFSVLYGEGWRRPKKTFDWFNEPHNKVANGKWTEEERQRNARGRG